MELKVGAKNNDFGSMFAAFSAFGLMVLFILYAALSFGSAGRGVAIYLFEGGAFNFFRIRILLQGLE